MITSLQDIDGDLLETAISDLVSLQGGLFNSFRVKQLAPDMTYRYCV